MPEIRKPAVAGSFYPGDPQTLSRQIRNFFSQVPRKNIAGEIIALMAPHAGYMYSGQVAAHAYHLIKGLKFNTVVVVSPSHRVHFHGASVYPGDGYETPLGVVPIDKDLTRELSRQSETIHAFPQAHAQEHALEVQVPFLQETLGTFQLVPIVIGEQSYATCEAVGKAVGRAAKGKKALVVASTDLSHFHPYDEARRLDHLFLENLKTFDPRKLNEELSSEHTEACGGGPVVAVMWAARELGANHVEVLKYLNSGDVTGDHSGVVGYSSAVFFRGTAAQQSEREPRKVGVNLGLTDEEKKTLREIALASIEARLRAAPLPVFENRAKGHLNEKRGAFVSLHRRGQLRGCIGLIQAGKPLHQTVEEMAAAAAFDDPRFEPLNSQEFRDLELEISVLTPFQKIKDVKEIEVGKHGIYIKRGYSTGLLLPQVGVEYKWGPITFLEETCRKAGLPRHAWKEKDTEIYIFSADIF